MRSDLEQAASKKERVIGRSFEGIDLEQAVLSGFRGEDLDFSRAHLGSSSLAGSRFDQTRFVRADLSDSDLTDAVLRVCDLSSCWARGLRMQQATFEDSVAEGADFEGSDWTDAKLTESRFDRSSFRGARLVRAQFLGASLRGADLSHAILTDASFAEADLRGADLRGAELAGADLRDADLRGALLDRELPEAPPIPEDARLSGLLDLGMSDADLAKNLSALLAQLGPKGRVAAQALSPLLEGLEATTEEPPEHLRAWLRSIMEEVGEDPTPEQTLHAVLRKLRE